MATEGIEAPASVPRDRHEQLPRWLLRVAAVAYLAGLLAVTTGPQPPDRLDIAGNILLTAPLGALLALRWPRLAPIAIVLAGFAASCAIESLQLIVLPERDASLNDIALNTSGAALGRVAGRTVGDLARWWRGSPPQERRKFSK